MRDAYSLRDMDKGIYTALSGGLAKAREVELIANNLANANTAGFKRDTGTFNEYLTEVRRGDSVDAIQREVQGATGEGRPSGDKSFVELDAVYTDFRQGTLQKSGRALDVAIEGTGFFEVLTPSGVRYSRQGNFSIDKEGHLVNSSGFPVLSQGAQAAPDQRVIRLGQGPIQITEEGFIIQNGAQLARIGVQEFHETQWLEKMGNSLFRNTNAENIKTGPNSTKLHQGFFEGSNVNAVTEMTRLIEATRSYESHMQAIKAYQEIDSKSVNEITK